MSGQANDDMCGLLSIYIPSVSTHPSDHPARPGQPPSLRWPRTVPPIMYFSRLQGHWPPELKHLLQKVRNCVPQSKFFLCKTPFDRHLDVIFHAPAQTKVERFLVFWCLVHYQSCGFLQSVFLGHFSFLLGVGVCNYAAPKLNILLKL